MFPYLRNVVTVVVVLQVIWNLRIFTQVYALQQRGARDSDRGAFEKRRPWMFSG